MSHSNTIINGNGVEFGSKTAQFLNFSFHLLAYFVQMHMPRHKLGK